MLSNSENRVRELAETKLTGRNKEEALLYHFSVGRKLSAVELFYNNIKTFIPKFSKFSGTATSSATSSATLSPPPSGDLIDVNSLIDDTSANIDSFFMSAKSTLDSFAHELRSLYGFAGHTGDLYFENAVDQIATNHQNTALHQFFTTSNITNLDWFVDLRKYRRACTHESIIPIRPSFDFDLVSGQWKDPILKLPLDPGAIPLTYTDKNFIETGKLIVEGLRIFLISSYDQVLTDILNNRTRIVP